MGAFFQALSTLVSQIGLGIIADTYDIWTSKRQLTLHHDMRCSRIAIAVTLLGPPLP
jgi:hypothetical protein